MAVTAVCRVAFLAWAEADKSGEAPGSPARERVYSFLKLCLQKRIGDGSTAVEIT